MACRDPCPAPLFDRFYRGDTARDREHGGSGIGLTISRAIANAHGGSLVAQSAGRGTGATFTVTLPPALSSTPYVGADTGPGSD